MDFDFQDFQNYMDSLPEATIERDFQHGDVVRVKNEDGIRHLLPVPRREGGVSGEETPRNTPGKAGGFSISLR